MAKSRWVLALFLLITTQASASVIVVGAGLAGLTAAYRIEQLTGEPVEVFEARDRPGGRVYTIQIGSGYEELGGKFLRDAGEAVHIRALADEFGLGYCQYHTDVSHRKYCVDGQVGLFYSAFLEGPVPNEATWQQFQQRALMAKNLGEVLDWAFGKTPVLRRLAELRMRNYEGNDSKDLAVGYLDSFWSNYQQGYQLALNQATVDTYLIDHIQGGNSRLVKALESAIRGPIHYLHPLTKLSAEGTQVRLEFGNGESVVTNQVILALPCSTLRDVEIADGLLPDDQLLAIESLQYGTNSKILAAVQAGKEIGDFHCTEGICAWFNRDNSIMTLYAGGSAGIFDSQSPEVVAQRLQTELPALQQMIPSLEVIGEPIGMSWINEPYSKGSYSSWGPDQFEFFNELIEVGDETVRKVFRPIDNRIYFAGEHTALGYTATMDGAVESGERAARMVSNPVSCHSHS